MMRVGETLRKFWPRKRRRNQRPLSRELKVAKTGVLLLFIFIILWLPYMVVHICSSGVKAPPTVFRLTMWLVFMNGVLNPIAYALGNSTVKMKFRQMFSTVFSLCCKCRWTEGQRVISRMSARVSIFSTYKYICCDKSLFPPPLPTPQLRPVQEF